MQKIKEIPLSYVFHILKEAMVKLKDGSVVISKYGTPEEFGELNDIISKLDNILKKMDIERKRWT